MARTAIPYTAAVPNGSVVATPTTIDATNDHVIAKAEPEKTVLRVVATTGGNLTIKAGVNPPALAAGLGDLSITVGVETRDIGPFESGRFLQADGSMLIDATTIVGTVVALKVPRNT